MVREVSRETANPLRHGLVARAACEVYGRGAGVSKRRPTRVSGRSYQGDGTEAGSQDVAAAGGGVGVGGGPAGAARLLAPEEPAAVHPAPAAGDPRPAGVPAADVPRGRRG